MAKIMVAPLFWGLIVFLIGVVVLVTYFIKHKWEFSNSKPFKVGVMIMVLAIIGMWLLSIPRLAVTLAGIAERDYDYSLEEVKVVTVLGSGIFPGRTREENMPGTYSTTRVIKGVRTFQKSQADLLVMQGQLSHKDHALLTEEMEALALDMGVEKARIKKESISQNTLEHPSELLNLEGVNEEDKIAVVTSAWHLPRAIGEFERYFSEIEAVPAEYHSYYIRDDLTDFLPQVRGLEISTLANQELIGRLWYQVQRWLPW